MFSIKDQIRLSNDEKHDVNDWWKYILFFAIVDKVLSPWQMMSIEELQKSFYDCLNYQSDKKDLVVTRWHQFDVFFRVVKKEWRKFLDEFGAHNSQIDEAIKECAYFIGAKQNFATYNNIVKHLEQGNWWVAAMMYKNQF